MANVTLNVTDGKGQATGSVEAPAELFGHTADEVQAHVPLIHQVVVAQLAAARQGTHATKTRGMSALTSGCQLSCHNLVHQGNGSFTVKKFCRKLNGTVGLSVCGVDVQRQVRHA